ncbi:hypothetical protein FYK55_28240 [Roseiconus nitratireducens]|uniref:Uncharacterized protein n=1 Tax=Roseiconus nitratireducens TaxID=2605748 RepID=A0A5M6CM69_9BACT|nr:hypothetical protein [Roseiconus nitratireducens]KAA5536087.1 hypothetical protein FYK55_28240 [Roseiconus nitratireducens]
MTLLLVCNSLSVFGESPIAPDFQPGELSFLKPGHAYIVRFSSGRELFEHTETGMTETFTRTPSGKKENVEPRRYKMSIPLRIFKVVERGGGPWVLMEHPSSSEDYARWSGKHRAIAILSSKQSPVSEDDPDAQDRLKRLREAAARNMPTTQTWINLDHAITIAEVSLRSLGIGSDD